MDEFNDFIIDQIRQQKSLGTCTYVQTSLEFIESWLVTISKAPSP